MIFGHKMHFGSIFRGGLKLWFRKNHAIKDLRLNKKMLVYMTRPLFTFLTGRVISSATRCRPDICCPKTSCQAAVHFAVSTNTSHFKDR